MLRQACLRESHRGLFRISGISTFGWRQTMPNDSGAGKLRPQPSRGHSAYSGIRHRQRTCARLCHLAGGEVEQIQFLLGHASVQTTERYLGCKQKLSQAVNDNLGLEQT
jgi:hypothetical protein